VIGGKRGTKCACPLEPLYESPDAVERRRQEESRQSSLSQRSAWRLLLLAEDAQMRTRKGEEKFNRRRGPIEHPRHPAAIRKETGEGPTSVIIERSTPHSLCIQFRIPDTFGREIFCYLTNVPLAVKSRRRHQSVHHAAKYNTASSKRLTHQMHCDTGCTAPLKPLLNIRTAIKFVNEVDI